MKVLSIVFLLLISTLASSQEISPSNVTLEQNNQWVDQVEKLDLANQLSVIKNRVLQDSCVYVSNTGYCGMIRTDQTKEKPKERKMTCYKPLLIFDGVAFDGKNIADFINEEAIKEIKILKGPSAVALYGTRGNAGVILFTFKSNESLNKMKKITAQD